MAGHEKPFGPYSDFADCVAKNGDKDDPDAYCAALMRTIEGGKDVLTVDEVAKLCVPCAEKMRTLGITSIRLSALKQMPPQLMEGLCARFSDPGFFTECAQTSFGDFEPGDKEAFCAWLHHECTGEWPGEQGAAAAAAGDGQPAGGVTININTDGKGRRHWHKSSIGGYLIAPLEVKARDDMKRTFTGALSASHLDLGDGEVQDIVHPGAFSRWIANVKGSTPPYVPLLDSHDRMSIMSVYGHLLDAEERLTGKMLEYPLADGTTHQVAEMYLDTTWQIIDGQDGDRLLARIKPGSVRMMSMGYEPLRWDRGQLATGSRIRHLYDVKVEEGSLVVFGMQPHALIDANTVKAVAALAGRLTSAQRDQLADLHPQLAAALAAPSKSKQPPVAGVPPSDPRRLAMEETLRALETRSLGR